MRIFLIDDTPGDLFVAVHALAHELGDVEVLEISSVDRVTQACRGVAPDLIVAHHPLRWADDLGVLHEMRRRFRHCPVIMCSAAIDRALAERASTLPVDQYLLDTPADLVRLSLAVRAVLERAAMHVRAARLERERDDAELLCSALAHDLREPLWAIRELAAALIEDEEGRLDESGEAYCRRLLESADRMQTLIHDLLAYYRLGRDDAPAEPVAIPGAIEEARRLLPNALRRSGGVIVSGDCLPVVIGHRTALVRVIANILGNAVKFVAPGVRPEVKIWAEPRDGLVRVWIEDNGIGISPDARQRIFEPLIRLHGQDRYAGTGIGLAYARRAVARMGGGIGVEPRVGGGSRFWIDLPNAALETSG